MRRKKKKKLKNMMLFCALVFMGFAAYALVLTGIANFNAEISQRPILPQQGRVE